MDNWATSFMDSWSEAVRIGNLLNDALKRAGFELSQFVSSAPGVLESLGVSPNRSDSVDLPLEKEATERFLGFTWNWVRDSLRLKISKLIPCRVATKRELLKAAASVYNPLGLLAVIKVQPKLLLQKTCRQKCRLGRPV